MNLKRCNIILSVFFALFIQNNLYSQETSWSVPDKIKNKMHHSEILGSSNNHYYIVRYNKSYNQDFIFTRYNKNMEIANQLEFQIDKGETIEKILMMGNMIYIFYSVFNKENKEYELYCTILNDRFSFTRRNVLIAATKVTPSNSNTFKINFDRVFQRILIVFPSEIKSDIVKFNFIVLNKQLDTYKISETIVSLRKEFSVEQLSLFGDNAAAIIRIVEEKGIFKSNIEKLRFFQLDLQDNKSNITELYNDTLAISTAVYKYNFNEQQYIISGLYFTDENEYFKGMAVYRTESKNNLASQKFIAFSIEMISALEGAGYKAKGLSDYYTSKLIVRDDGGFVIMAEKFTITKEVMNNYYSLNNTYIRYFYRFGDILITSFDQNNNVEWTKVIKKDQTTLNDEGYYSSFHSSAFSGQIVVIYNDISRSNWNLMINSINPEGKIDYSIISNTGKVSGNPIPKSSRQVSSNEILVPVINVSKGFTLMRITF